MASRTASKRFALAVFLTIMGVALLLHRSPIFQSMTYRQVTERPIPLPKPDLSTNLTYLCQNKQVSCVIDFTAPPECALNGADLPMSAEPMNIVLDRFTSACTLYRWEKQGNTFVVEPKLPTDRSLAVQTGPIRELLSSSDLMRRLCGMTNLPWDEAWTGGLRSAGPAMVQEESVPRVDFNLARASFKTNLIRAANQSGHSYWLIARYPGNPLATYTGPMYECRANDLNSKIRYISRSQ